MPADRRASPETPARAPSLRETEERFFQLITAPTGVTDGLRALGLAAADLERMVRSDARRSAVGRLDVYAEMYFFRIRDAMKELFPALAAVLGEVAFHNLVTDYLLAHPSRHPSLHRIGDALPEFLAAKSWWGDLARLELARSRIFEAPDAETLSLEALRARPPESFATLPLTLIPAHVLLHVGAAVDEVWSAATLAAPVPEPEPIARTLLVWRNGVEVLHRALERDEAESLALAEAGRPFGAICDHLVATQPDGGEAEVAERAFRLLATWVAGGLLCAALD
jgi:hypothetical protein